MVGSKNESPLVISVKVRVVFREECMQKENGALPRWCNTFTLPSDTVSKHYTSNTSPIKLQPQPPNFLE